MKIDYVSTLRSLCYIDQRFGVRLLLALCTSVLLTQGVLIAQSQQGDVVGSLSGGVVKYQGELSDDSFGPGAFFSLRYAAMDRLWIEARFGLGEYRWKITDAKLARYPDYFGANAQIGDLYPASITTIEPENESRVTLGDLSVSYVLVDGIPASPFITAGVGVVNFAPSTSESHTQLPNSAAGNYPHTVASIILGGGVQIPVSERVGILLRGEHRFVFSSYLDDISFNGSNDALSTFSIGLTYRFNEPEAQEADPGYDNECEDCEECGDNCDECCDEVSDCDQRCLGEYSKNSCCCCAHCCCCCCGKAATPAVEAPAPAPATVPSPGPGPVSAPVSGPVPEPMDVPCPAGQHRECYGPPGYGICVDDDPPKGPEPILWELARPLDDGSLLREVDGKWYRKQILTDGTVRVTKGLLPFEASECKECKEKQRRENQR